ncbi:MAG: undecaprenyl-phosphate glucose phosphotransferase [Phycisphaerales bacterium]|jgi:Undecaprenyl-phosphate glucose phosphotransferase|nr:undecaprenyl-phosphate glucose phosphotransferase [Phycisphaerales bacterium]
MLKQRHQLFVSLLVACDVAVVAAACYAAWGLRKLLVERWWPPQWETYLKEPLVLFVVPLSLLSLRAVGLYRARREKSITGELWSIIRASAVAFSALIMFLWFADHSASKGESTYGRAHLLGIELGAWRVQLGSLAILLPVMLSIERTALRLTLRWLRRRGKNLRHVVVVGTGRLAQVTCRTLERNRWTGLNVAGFVTHRDAVRRSSILGLPVLGTLGELEDIIEQVRPDAVYIALQAQHAHRVPGVIRSLDRFSVDVRLVPDVDPRYMPLSRGVTELDGMPILSCRESPQEGLGGMSKRALDVVGASVALAIFGPVMALCALFVRMSGPGPVIFTQKRVSLGGEEFSILKFRTMRHVEEPELDPAWTSREDPRITGVGRFLRRTSLDELPQLFNVLRGDMSLVGPRPERPELIERFRDDWRGYMLRQHVKAGMTGWAQVRGLRGDTSLKKRLQHDLYYIRNWSLGLDVKILMLTVFRGFVHRNAH